MPKVNLRPQNPLKNEVKTWTKAIEAVDRHSRKCRQCSKRVMSKAMMLITNVFQTWEPYKPCDKAIALWNLEKQARLDYQAKGGKLPVEG